jgi:chromosome segregation ATPase
MSQSLQEKEDKLRLMNTELEAVEKRTLNRRIELDGVLRELQQADSRRSDIDRAILAGTNQLLELQGQLEICGEVSDAEKKKMQTSLQSQEETMISLRENIQVHTQKLQHVEARLLEKCNELGYSTPRLTYNDGEDDVTITNEAALRIAIAINAKRSLNALRVIVKRK